MGKGYWFIYFFQKEWLRIQKRARVYLFVVVIEEVVFTLVCHCQHHPMRSWQMLIDISSTTRTRQKLFAKRLTRNGGPIVLWWAEASLRHIDLNTFPSSWLSFCSFNVDVVLCCQHTRSKKKEPILIWQISNQQQVKKNRREKRKTKILRSNNSAKFWRAQTTAKIAFQTLKQPGQHSPFYSEHFDTNFEFFEKRKSTNSEWIQRANREEKAEAAAKPKQTQPPILSMVREALFQAALLLYTNVKGDIKQRFKSSSW